MGGKKKGKQKAKGTTTPPKPKDERTLPFLQDMFPNVEKDIVSIIYEQNEYDEDKTILQLEELSLDEGPSKNTLAYEEDPALLYTEEAPKHNHATNNLPYNLNEFEDIDAGDIELAMKLSQNHKVTTQITPYTSITTIPASSNNTNNNKNNKQEKNLKRQTPPPFISTTTDNTTFYAHSLNPAAIKPFSTFSSFPSLTTPTNTTTSTSTSTSTSRAPITPPAFEDGGDSKQFLSSMFPELDETMVALLYEENGNDVGKTVESLLSIVFMNLSGSGAETEEDGDAEGEEESEQHSHSNHFGEEEGEDEVGDALEDEEQFDSGDIDSEEYMENLTIEIPKPIVPIATDNTSAMKSDFIVKLNLLAELFPDTPRTLLALELDELDCDLEKTIASCCRADPEYLRKLSGEKVTVIAPPPNEEERPKFPAAVDTVLRPSWIGAGNSHSNLVNTTKVRYVKPTPPPAAVEKAKKKPSEKAKGKQKAPVASPKRRGMDLAAKLKLKQLKEKFSFADPDILESVFVQSGYKFQETLVCLYDIYPHLREHAAAPSHAGYKNEPSPPHSPEIPLSRKREKPDIANQTPTQTAQPNGDKPRKTKRTKPADENGEEDEGEFVTVSYRKKKAEGAAAPKKVMDSDDIENAYQGYREQAIKSGEMRNLLFMQAAAAYSAGDGAKAKALSQRAREYDEMMKDAHRQACHQIFVDCNARLDTLASVDLHGLHVAEALQVISRLLEIHRELGETNKKQPKNLRVITGQGRHSLHGIAKIKPAVKNFLRSKGYSFAETEPGVITIALSRS